MQSVFAIEPPDRKNALEITGWAALYVAFALPMALGHSNGIGYFQQPDGHALWAPLLLGGILNFYVIYIHSFNAMPHLLEKGGCRKYARALSAIIAAYLIGHLAYQIILANSIEPALRPVSVAAWTMDNAFALPVVLLISALYCFGRDWVIHMPRRKALVEKTDALEKDFSVVKDELSDLKSGALSQQFLRFDCGRQKVQILAQSICFLKAAGNYVEIVSRDKRYTAYGSLSDFEARLPEDKFVRVHRSHIVNLEKIKTINGRQVEIEMADDAVIDLPIGQTYKAILLARWAQSV